LFKPGKTLGHARIPSPALVISIIALIAALGGGYAIAKGGDKKSDKKIANKQITKRAPGLSVLHAKTADNATDSANAAKVGGSTVTTIYKTQPPGTSEQTIFSSSAFTITMACTGGDETDAFLNVNGSETQANSEGQSDNGGAFTREDNENGTSTVDITDTSTRSDGGSTFAGSTSAGASISGQVDWSPADETFNTSACVLSGFVFVR
jgi:hypothetical protein